MRSGHLRWQPAHHATAVALHERQPLSSGEQPLLAPPVEDLSSATQHRRDDPSSGRHPATRGDADRLVEAVDGGEAGSGVQLVEPDAHDDRRPRDGEPPVVASARVRADLGERIGLQHRDRAAIGIRSFGVEHVRPRLERRRDVRLDRRLDRSAGGDVGLQRQVQRPVALEHRQRTPRPGLIFTRSHTVGVEPRLGMHDKLAHVVERQPCRALDQQTLGFDGALQAGFQPSPVEQSHDRRRCRRAEGADTDRLLHLGIPRRQRLADEVRPRCRGLAHLHQPRRIARGSARRRGDHGGRAAETLFLGQARRPQLGSGFPCDARRELGVDAVESALHQSHRAVRLEQLRPGQLGSTPHIGPHLFEALHGLDQGVRWGFAMRQC